MALARTLMEQKVAMKRIKPHRVCTVMLWLYCAFASGGVSAETWRVKKFEIFVGQPEKSTFFGWQDVEKVPTTPLPKDVKKDIEEYLAWSAETLERLGFKQPVLEPIVKNAQGEDVYRIYYRDLEGDNKATPAYWKDDQCGKARPEISLNARVMLRELPSGKLVVADQSYQNLAHELFHAVQASYPLFKEHCWYRAGDWIFEATAEAVGIDMAAWGYKKIARPKYPTEAFKRPGAWWVKRWGLRAYDVPTYIKEGKPGDKFDGWYYETSSFWRFLGEYAATRGAMVPEVYGPKSLSEPVNLEDVEPREPHWQYLIDFFNSRIGGDEPTLSNSMRWIHKQISNDERFGGLGLHQMFPLFVNTFATYGGTRAFIKTPESSQEERKEKAVQDKNSESWMGNLFKYHECPSVELFPSEPVKSSPFEIYPFAANCYAVTSHSYFPTDVHVSVSGDSRIQLQALRIGATTGPKRSRDIARAKITQRGSEWRANWVFTLQPGLRENFIFTNMSLWPEQTTSIRSEVEFSATDSENNMAVYGPMPPPYGPQPPSKTPSASSKSSNQSASTPSRSRPKNLAGELEAGMDTLNPNTAHGNRMKRNANAGPCRNPFESAACGPHTTIRLEMMPGMFGNLMTNTGSGGMFGQFTSMMSGTAGTEMMFSSEKTQAALEHSGNMDASLVVIKIPLIDYGFTGTFKNASIVANRKGGGSWKAVEPGEGNPSTGQGPRLTGQVTIEEYSPTILRGSYSGNLVESYESGQETGDKAPATRFINGNFQVVATWTGDDRIVLVPDEPDQVMDDLTEQFGVDTSAYEVIQAGDRKRVVTKQADTSTSVGGGSTSGECSCECEYRELADELCEMFCEEEFAACDAN